MLISGNIFGGWLWVVFKPLQLLPSLCHHLSFVHIGCRVSARKIHKWAHLIILIRTIEIFLLYNSWKPLSVNYVHLNSRKKLFASASSCVTWPLHMESFKQDITLVTQSMQVVQLWENALMHTFIEQNEQFCDFSPIQYPGLVPQQLLCHDVFLCALCWGHGSCGPGHS